MAGYYGTADRHCTPGVCYDEIGGPDGRKLLRVNVNRLRACAPRCGVGRWLMHSTKAGLWTEEMMCGEKAPRNQVAQRRACNWTSIRRACFW